MYCSQNPAVKLIMIQASDKCMLRHHVLVHWSWIIQCDHAVLLQKPPSTYHVIEQLHSDHVQGLTGGR